MRKSRSVTSWTACQVTNSLHIATLFEPSMEGKSHRGAGSRNLGFFVGEVKVLFRGFGLSVFDLVLWFRAIWIPIGYEPKGSTQKTASTNT
jgi:hypothetical protein